MFIPQDAVESQAESQATIPPSSEQQEEHTPPAATGQEVDWRQSTRQSAEQHLAIGIEVAVEVQGQIEIDQPQNGQPTAHRIDFEEEIQIVDSIEIEKEIEEPIQIEVGLEIEEEVPIEEQISIQIKVQQQEKPRRQYMEYHDEPPSVTAKSSPSTRCR